MTKETYRIKLQEIITNIKQDEVNYGLSSFIADIISEAKENPEFYYNYKNFNKLIEISIDEINLYNPLIQEQASEALCNYLSSRATEGSYYISSTYPTIVRDTLKALVRNLEERFKPFIRNRQIVEQLTHRALTNKE